MGQRWHENTSSGPRVIGGKLLSPGEGTWVDDGPLAGDPSPRLTRANFNDLAADGRLVDGQFYNVDGTLFQAISAFDSIFVGAVYTAAQLTALAQAGGLTPYARYVESDTGNEYRAISTTALVPVNNVEVTPYITLTATGTAFSGACELAGYYCSVAAGSITIYDALSATGTPIVPATALAVGPFPIFGAGTNGKLRLGTGCYVVLSAAATVRMLVG